MADEFPNDDLSQSVPENFANSEERKKLLAQRKLNELVEKRFNPNKKPRSKFEKKIERFIAEIIATGIVGGLMAAFICWLIPGISDEFLIIIVILIFIGFRISDRKN